MHAAHQSPRPVAIVTGADSGIGKATAVVLAAGGFDIGITWHTDHEGALRTAREVQGMAQRVELRRMDLANLPEAADVIDDLIGDLGRVDAFVNNAGTGHRTPFLDLDFVTWRSVLSVDLDGAFLCAQKAARAMVEQGSGGRIINVTSVHEHVPLEGSSAYCAAKGGLGLLTKVMALELAEHGIMVNAVAPGEITTPMTGAEDVDPETVERPGLPMARPGDAREVAELIAFLASPRSGYITGSSYAVDGGLLLMAAEANRRLQPA
jgi:NAD(P)-dependent dehydrogenase (short-subunit alcohol dehydrogenase family)